MNRKIISVFVVAMFFATALVCITPQSEAKSIGAEISGNVGDYNYYYGKCYTPTENTTIESGYQDRMMLFEGDKKTEVIDAINNGKDLTDIAGYKVVSSRMNQGTEYFLVYFENWEQSSVYVGLNPGFVNLDYIGKNPCKYKSIEIPVTEGSKVSITISTPTNDNYAAVAVISKTLKYNIDHQSQYNTVWTKIKDNTSEVVGILMDENFEFTSDKVTDYYLIVFSTNESNYGPPVHVDFNVTINGAADTSNPMVFAVLFFVIAIAAVAGIVYLARKKIIE